MHTFSKLLNNFLVCRDAVARNSADAMVAGIADAHLFALRGAASELDGYMDILRMGHFPATPDQNIKPQTDDERQHVLDETWPATLPSAMGDLQSFEQESGLLEPRNLEGNMDGPTEVGAIRFVKDEPRSMNPADIDSLLSERLMRAVAIGGIEAVLMATSLSDRTIQRVIDTEDGLTMTMETARKLMPMVHMCACCGQDVSGVSSD